MDYTLSEFHTLFCNVIKCLGCINLPMLAADVYEYIISRLPYKLHDFSYWLKRNLTNSVKQQQQIQNNEFLPVNLALYSVQFIPFKKCQFDAASLYQPCLKYVLPADL